ncbi:uncharacterized protein LOC131928686 [Physella acuta]|uniref:uncharacterized protein LOC131928686 n=1 Tax=Physella acuta TaxID=109671 RepID=UPI0027DD5633|nr:uncharacterized protein LOC131928686 [Physella acuta]
MSKMAQRADTKLLSCLLVLTVMTVCISPTTGAQLVGPGGEESCDQLRLQIAQNFRQAYDKTIPAHYLKDLLTMWVESSLPAHCSKNTTSGLSKFNPSSTLDSGGPLGTLGPSGSVYTTSLTSKRRRDTSQSNTHFDDVINAVDPELSRQKRFIIYTGTPADYGTGTFGSGIADPASPAREVTEAEQMMKAMLMLSNYQKTRLTHEMRTGRISGGSSSGGEKPPIGSGMYGEQYPGRKKREAGSLLHAVARGLSRRKRFLLSMFDAETPTPGPSIFSIMSGTARDPNTGKPLEFGGDAMKNMMVNQFVSTLPFSAQPPPGKEPADFVKNMAPLWYYSRLQRSMSPQPRFYSPHPHGSYNYIPKTYHHQQQRNRDGYYGDAFPGKRKRRSASGSDGGSTDVITIGDLTIPIEFFKPADLPGDTPAYTSGDTPAYTSGDTPAYTSGDSSAGEYKREYKREYTFDQHSQRQTRSFRGNQQYYGDRQMPARYASRHITELYHTLMRNRNRQHQNPTSGNPRKYSQPSKTPTQPYVPHTQLAQPHVPHTQFAQPSPSYSLHNSNFFNNFNSHQRQQQRPDPPTPPTTPPPRPPTPPVPRQPIDPFILPPPSAHTQQLPDLTDPFIPNPPTPPPPSSTSTTPAGEHGRRKRSADGQGKQHSRRRHRRSEKTSDTANMDYFPFTPYNPDPFWSLFDAHPSVYQPHNNFPQPHNNFPQPHNNYPHSSNYFHQFNPSPCYTRQYSDSRHSSNKVGYVSENGGVVYGDHLPWSTAKGTQSSEPQRLGNRGEVTPSNGRRVKRSDSENTWS